MRSACLNGLDTIYDCLINRGKQMKCVPDVSAVLSDLVTAGKMGNKAQKSFFNYE